jgi:hypothetical protein
VAVTADCQVRGERGERREDVRAEKQEKQQRKKIHQSHFLLPPFTSSTLV